MSAGPDSGGVTPAIPPKVCRSCGMNEEYVAKEWEMGPEGWLLAEETTKQRGTGEVVLQHLIWICPACQDLWCPDASEDE